MLVPFVGNHLITARREGPRWQNVVAADGRRPGRDRRDPHRDDHADHDRADLRGARRRARTPGARARSRSASTRCARCSPSRCARRARRSSRRRCSRRARALGEAVMISMVSGAALLRAQADRRRRCSSSSRCARSPRRSSTTTKGSARRRSRSTLYAFALLLLFSASRAVGRRLPDQAAAAQVPGARMSTLRTRRPRGAPGADVRAAAAGAPRR